jgi:hypothetical protein
MHTGSMIPLPIDVHKEYLAVEKDLPVEEARRVMFQKRQSLPNHYNQQTPTSKLQSIGQSIIYEH